MNFLEHCMQKFFRLKNCCLDPEISDALIRTLYAKVILTEELLVNTTYFWYID